MRLLLHFGNIFNGSFIFLPPPITDEATSNIPPNIMSFPIFVPKCPKLRLSQFCNLLRVATQKHCPCNPATGFQILSFNFTFILLSLS